MHLNTDFKMKQTAVETLIEIYYGNEGQLTIKDLEQAKEMEKEQIKDSFLECWKANVPDGIECKLDAER